jgi:BirA family biotin operon repressor/biotin-[acetyl-CoA-carboxylase] ligase
MDQDAAGGDFSEQLKKILSTGPVNWDFYFLDETGSTMDVARDLLRRKKCPIFVLAERQTAGRGRHGRRWISSQTGNIYLTLGLPNFAPDRDIGPLSTELAMAIADAFARQFSIVLKVKLPNDLLLDGAKVGGILLETDGDGLAVGIGLNLVHDNTLQGQCSQKVTSLQAAAPLERIAVIPVLCQCVFDWARPCFP